MSSQKKIALTFDVDCYNYFTHQYCNEFETFVPHWIQMQKKYKQLCATFFVRMDSEVNARFGNWDYYFQKYNAIIDQLKILENEIGWHYHATIQNEKGQWKQHTDTELILTEFDIAKTYIKNYNLKSSRMGWCFHNSKTMNYLEKLNLTVDSSALPRPNYSWDIAKRDWSATGQSPYWPSRNNYQLEEEMSSAVLQIPISTMPIAVSSDTEMNVMRYLHLGYKPEVFQKACIQYLSQFEYCIAIAHPCELLEKEIQHELFGNTKHNFHENINYLLQSNFEFLTVNQIGKTYQNKKQ